jgi:hypothetical protein
MKAHLTAAIAVTLILAGCASASAPDSSNGSTPATSTAPDAPSGDLDCAALTGSEVADYSVGIQVLAQLRDQGVVDSLNDGILTYDAAAMASTLESLRALAGRGVPGLGDPGEAVDFYLGANEIAGRILAVNGPVPQELFDELIAYEGELSDFLYHQIAINAALDENCK